MHAVHTDDFGVRDHCELTVVRVRRLAEASPQPSHVPLVASRQHDEHALAALHGVDTCGGRARLVAGLVSGV
jgi:hypothetical protein